MRWLRTDLSVLFFDNSFWKVSKKSSFRLFLAIALNYLKRSSAFRRKYVNRLKNITREKYHPTSNQQRDFRISPNSDWTRTFRSAWDVPGNLLCQLAASCASSWTAGDSCGGTTPGTMLPPLTIITVTHVRSLTSLSLTHLLSITTKTAESRTILWNLNVVYILRHPSYTTWNEI